MGTTGRLSDLTNNSIGNKTVLAIFLLGTGIDVGKDARLYRLNFERSRQLNIMMVSRSGMLEGCRNSLLEDFTSPWTMDADAATYGYYAHQFIGNTVLGEE